MNKLTYKPDFKGYFKMTLIRLDGNEGYLAKIIEDAVKAENPRCGVETAIKSCGFEQWELPDGSHWVTVDGNFCNYARVTRRVAYRLSNNSWIEKKEVFYEEEYFDVPGQWCCECRYWFKEV